MPEDEWGNLSLTEAKKVQSDLVKVAKALDWKEQTIRNICGDWIEANCGIKNEIAETTEAKAEAEAEAGAEEGCVFVELSDDPETAEQLSELNKRFQAAKADKNFAKRIEGKTAQEVIDAFITFESGKAQKAKRLAKAKKPAAKSRAAAAAKVASPEEKLRQLCNKAVNEAEKR